MRLLFGGFQKECLRLGHLLALADERSQLPPSVMVPLLFPGLAVGDLMSGAYFLFELNFCLRSTYTHVGRILLQQRRGDFRPFLTLQPDFMPFTTYIAFPEPTWVSILQRFTLRGYFQILSGDVPLDSGCGWYSIAELDFFSSLSFTFSVAELVLSSSARKRLCTWYCPLCGTWFSNALQQLYAHDDFRSVLEQAVHRLLAEGW